MFYPLLHVVVLVVKNLVANAEDAGSLSLYFGGEGGDGDGQEYHSLFQEIFLSQGSNPDLPHCRWKALLPELPGKSRGCSFDPWMGKIPWKRKWQPAPVLLPRKSHGQRSLAGCCS